MTTAQTLITDAYIESRVTGPVDAPDASQLTVGLRWLNRIIALMSTKNVLIPYSTSENFSITDGQASYTMGSGGTASSTRAMKILSAYVQDSAGSDYPIRVISEKDYNRIGDKDLEGPPSKLFYDPVYDTGVIYFWKVPGTTYTAYIESQKVLHSTLTLLATVSLPAEYEEALVLSLASKIAGANGSPRESSLGGAAASAWRTIANFNASQRVPTARLPFSHSGGSDWLFEE